MKHFIDELTFIEQLAGDEGQQIVRQIEQAATNNDDPFEAIRAMFRVVADNLGQVKARQLLMETELAKLQLSTSDVLNKSWFGAAVAPHSVFSEGGIAAGELLAGVNLYPVEYAQDGFSYRWTGPGQEVRLLLPLDRSKELVGRVNVVSVLYDECLRDVRVKLDGKFLHLIEQPTMETGIQFVVPESEGEAQSVLQIMTGRCVSPLDVGKGDDRRPLGIAFNSLEFAKR